ncbi:hypothetical protein M413DRAFT_446094, partial [Hebeloma cylindrosporum]
MTTHLEITAAPTIITILSLVSVVIGTVLSIEFHQLASWNRDASSRRCWQR